jgi:hypothetical protein
MQKLEDFVKEMRAEVLRFERYWVKRNKQTPKQYPMQMASGDWDEQFAAFFEIKEPE